VLSSVGAYGLALQAMGEGKITSSLLPLQIRRERMWRDKTKWFAAAAALFVLGTGVAFGRYFYEDMQYKAADPQRGEISREMEAAQDLATKWDAVEKSGAPEKTQIASLQALTRLREMWPRIVASVDKALPELTPAEKAKKRNERPIVQLEDMTSVYFEDLTPAVAKDPGGAFTMSTTDFIKNRANSVGGGGGYRPGGRMTQVLGGLGTAAPAAGTEGAPVAAKQRGYLLTLTCTTPMQPGSERVTELVREALLAQTKPVGQEKQDFRIERVDFAEGVQLRNAPQQPNRLRQNQNVGTRRQRKYKPAAMPVGGLPGVSPGGLFGAGNPAAAAAAAAARNNPRARANPPGSPVRTYRQPGLPEGDVPLDETQLQQQHQMPALNFDITAPLMQPQNLDPNQPMILDPVTGEDAATDNRLTFLVAVLVDPAPPAPHAPPPGTEAPAEGQEAAPVE
jgi:hypothetical protein